MARTLVLINGSPVEGSSVHRLLEALAEGYTAAGGAARWFTPHAMTIGHCLACGPDATSGYCVIRDDMDALYGALESAHTVAVGSPVYFDTVSGPLKLLMDRCNCVTPLVTLEGGGEAFLPRWRRTRHGVFMTACSSAHRYDLAERSVRGFLKWIGARWSETVVWQHDDNVRGSVPAERLDEARALGARLAAREPLSPGQA
jgi:NAD(P)H-dependent FMN reductase